MKRFVSLACATTLLLTACPSPQTSTPSNTQTVDVYRIEGDVYLPQSDVSAILAQSFSLPNPMEFLMPPAQAATGLTKAPEGVEVRLIRIDNEGRNVSTEPIATAKTDADGHYVLDVDVSKASLPATNLVLEVGNYQAGTYLRNFAIGERIDLSPVTTAATQLLVDRNEPLLDMPTTVIAEAMSRSEDTVSSLSYASVTLSNALNTTYNSLQNDSTLKTRLDQLLTRVISGVVLAPNGQIAALPSQKRWDSWLVPSAAALEGLQSVASNTTVNLYKIDNNGNIVGQPLATTKTRSDGSYSIILPAEAIASSEFVVAVGSGSSQLRAFVSGSSNLDISPLSEATVRLVINNGSVLNQPKIPITEYSPAEINAILQAVQQSTNTTTLGGASSVSSVMSLIEPIIQADSTVLSTLRAVGGIPGPTVVPVNPSTAQDSIVLNGTAQPGSLITVTGGTSVVQTTLGASASNFTITVPLKRNSPHTLNVTATVGGQNSLPTVVELRQDNLNPVIDTSKIIARNPSGSSFETIITGSTGSIQDNGRATVLISGAKLGNSTTVQTDDTGAFTANLAADTGDVLTLTVVDGSGNRNQASIVVGGPGPVISGVSQESTVSRDAPFAERVITVTGAGFNTTLTDNVVTYISSRGSQTITPRSVSSDRRSMVVPVVSGLVDRLSELPTDIRVKVNTDGIDSNENRSFTLFPTVTPLVTSNLEGNGKAEFFHFDGNNIFMTQQKGADSSIMLFDSSGNILSRDIAKDFVHDSVFVDAAVDEVGHLLVSNFDATLVGRPKQDPKIRPTYRISKYQMQGNNAQKVITARLGESAELNSKPGAIALSKTNNKLYVALPSEGRIMKMDYVGGVFGRPEELIAGLPKPIKDIALDEDGKFMYITLGDNISMFKLTLNANGDLDLTNSSFVSPMGNGNGHIAIGEDNNIYVSVGTGVERVNEQGEHVNLVPVLRGISPTVGVTYVNNQIFVNQLNVADLFKITP